MNSLFWTTSFFSDTYKLRLSFEYVKRRFSDGIFYLPTMHSGNAIADTR